MYSYHLKTYACIQTSILEKAGSNGGEQSKTMQSNLSKKHKKKNRKSIKGNQGGKINKIMKDKRREKSKNMKVKRRGKTNKSIKVKRRVRNNKQKHRQKRKKNKLTYSPMRRLANLGQLNTKATFHNQQASRALVSLSEVIRGVTSL